MQRQLVAYELHVSNLKDFRTRTLKALTWGLGSQFATQAMSIVFGIVLARLLVPEDFGLIAMVMVVMGMAALLSDVGLGAALIQKKNINEDHLSSVFWVNLLLGIVLMFGFFLLAPLLSAFYGNENVELIAKVLSVNFVIGALTMVPMTILRKKLAFREIAYVGFTSMALSGGVAIVIANSGYGYWSLVFQQITQQLVAALMVWYVGKWRPKVRHDITAIRDLLGFSINVFLTSILLYVSRKLATFLIAKDLGAQSAGLQDKAHSMMLFPIQNISHVLGSVMFPSFSLIRDDVERVKSVFLKAISAVSLITFPMMGGMFVVSDSFVLGVLGEQWKEVIPLFQVYCFTGLVVSVVTLTGAIYLSQGASALQLRVNIVTQSLMMIGIVIGLAWGVMGVIVGLTIVTYCNALITWRFAGALINLSILEILKNLFPSIVICLILAVLVYWGGNIYGETPGLGKFLFQIMLGALIYPCLLVIIKPRGYRVVKSLVFEKMLKKKHDKNSNYRDLGKEK